jgi:hypothetical protein
MMPEIAGRDLSEAFSLPSRIGRGGGTCRTHRDKTDKTLKLYPLAIRPLTTAADLSEAHHLAILRPDR